MPSLQLPVQIPHFIQQMAILTKSQSYVLIMNQNSSGPTIHTSVFPNTFPSHHTPTRQRRARHTVPQASLALSEACGNLTLPEASNLLKDANLQVCMTEEKAIICITQGKKRLKV